MLQLKQIIKSFFKNKLSSILSLLSLVMAFTGIIIISLYVSFENSFDKFHKNREHIYRLETKSDQSWLPAIMSETIKDNFPEVENITPAEYEYYDIKTLGLNKENISFDSKVYFVNNSFFQIFTFPLKTGNPQTVLEAPYSAVISEKLSKNLFGSENTVGKTLSIDGRTYTIKGIMENFPKNSSIQTDCLLSFSTVDKEYSYINKWGNWSCSIFMKLDKASDPQNLIKKIENQPEISKEIADDKEYYGESGAYMLFRPIDKIHYCFDNSSTLYANPLILRVLLLLIIMLAIMGGVNFINFSTSQAPLRAKALSINRVLGARKSSSRTQIIGESVILAFFAMVVSLIIAISTSSHLESLFQISGLSIQGRLGILVVFVLCALFFGIIIGIYPSRYITTPPLSQTIKGNIQFSGKGKIIRNGLIVIQFAVTIALIASSFIIEKQLNYWHNYDTGLNKEHVVYLKTSKEIQKHSQGFSNELMQNPEIKDYSYCGDLPGDIDCDWGRQLNNGQYIQFRVWPIDDRFIDFFDIEILKGRKFSGNDNKNGLNFIINEKSVEKFAWENPLDIILPGYGDGNGKVLGVTNNFNFSSLKEAVVPLAFYMDKSATEYILLRLNPGNYTQTIADINNTAQKFDPSGQFEVRFFDDALNDLYKKEQSMARFIEFVAVWSIILSITGLLGLIIFISRDRIKEIGIRKVNGARIGEVVLLLNIDFIKWLLIACVIAIPFAWYGMQKWLQQFAYRTTINWWIFLFAGVSALFFALLAISWQSWRAAIRNPVEALRYE